MKLLIDSIGYKSANYQLEEATRERLIGVIQKVIEKTEDPEILREIILKNGNEYLVNIALSKAPTKENVELALLNSKVDLPLSFYLSVLDRFDDEEILSKLTLSKLANYPEAAANLIQKIEKVEGIAEPTKHWLYSRIVQATDNSDVIALVLAQHPSYNVDRSAIRNPAITPKQINNILSRHPKLIIDLTNFYEFEPETLKALLDNIKDQNILLLIAEYAKNDAIFLHIVNNLNQYSLENQLVMLKKIVNNPYAGFEAGEAIYKKLFTIPITTSSIQQSLEEISDRLRYRGYINWQEEQALEEHIHGTSTLHEARSLRFRRRIYG